MHEQRTPPSHRSMQQARKKTFRAWRFSPKDVVVIGSVALVLSGLMGLGAVMLVEIAEKILTWL